MEGCGSAVGSLITNQQQEDIPQVQDGPWILCKGEVREMDMDQQRQDRMKISAWSTIMILDCSVVSSNGTAGPGIHQLLSSLSFSCCSALAISSALLTFGLASVRVCSFLGLTTTWILVQTLWFGVRNPPPLPAIILITDSWHLKSVDWFQLCSSDSGVRNPPPPLPAIILTTEEAPLPNPQPNNKALSKEMYGPGAPIPPIKFDRCPANNGLLSMLGHSLIPALLGESADLFQELFQWYKRRIVICYLHCGQCVSLPESMMNPGNLKRADLENKAKEVPGMGAASSALTDLFLIIFLQTLQLTVVLGR